MIAVRILFRNIRDAFVSVIRNLSLSIASITSITITLLVVAISIILTYNVNNFAKQVERDVTIVAFLKNDVTDEEIETIKIELNKIESVANFNFKYKEDIAEEMSKASETFKNIMQNYTDEENPLQDTILVKATSLEKVKDVALKIEKLSGVSTVKYGEGMIDQLIKVFDYVRQISIGVVVALIVVTAFLISNTIKIAIFARKREIEIMRLVGASNLNIKIPFVLEGLILGVLGATIPIIATIYGYVTLYENFNGQVLSPFVKLVQPQPFIYSVSLILLVIGILVGMFGSWNAVRRHLKI